MEKIKINEIFFSIQGESSWIGLPTVFVRTSGCHLRCQYCDTTYAYYEGHFLPIDEIKKKIYEYPTNYVCITGGEPLLQKPVLTLMNDLCLENYKVSLETSGAKSVRRVNPKVKVILDIKTPGSKEVSKNDWSNLDYLQPHWEIKFVVCNESDWDWLIRKTAEFDLFKRVEHVLVSPSFDEIHPRWLAEKVLESRLPFRMQIQMHKTIWGPSKRGV